MTLVSPFLIEDVPTAYAAYCAMPHMKREGAKKPGLKKFRQMHAQKHAKLVAKKSRTTTPDTPAVATPNSQFEQFLAFQAYMAAQNGSTGVETTTPSTRKYRTRLAKDAVPKDAASNAMLWALNTEGLLAAALAESDESYITRDVATAVLNNEFGPLA